MAPNETSKFRAGIHKAEASVGLTSGGAEEAFGAASETAREGLSAGAEAFGQATEQARDTAQEAAGAMGEGMSRATQQAGQLAQQSLQSLVAMSDAGRVMAAHVQDVSREMMAIAEETMRHQMNGWTTLASCRTLPELMAAQAGFARQSMERFVENQRRLAQATMRLADETRGQMSRLAEDGAARRAA